MAADERSSPIVFSTRGLTRGSRRSADGSKAIVIPSLLEDFCAEAQRLVDRKKQLEQPKAGKKVETPSSVKSESPAPAKMAGKKQKELAPLYPFIYDTMLWSFSILVDLFFREVHPRGSWKIPRRGPVIFVAAPHANQFVDPLILMRTIHLEAHRRVSFLVAAKSMKLKLIGFVSRCAGAVPVARAMDSLRVAPGKIYLPNPVNDPLLVRGIDVDFTSPAFQIGGTIQLPKYHGEYATAQISEILGPNELRLKKEFKRSVLPILTGKTNLVDGKVQLNNDFQGTNYKLAPHIDQTRVYDAVFHRLNSGDCVGIFPEGGSHDRTELLPLKAGVAIMALGALAEAPDSGLKIVPCGMNYFHAHKFRSRAVVEFGAPMEVPRELVELYKKGERREAVGKLLEMIYQSLVSVTVTSPDYDTLMLIQAARRLYNPTHKKLPLPVVVELNRRLVKGYTHYKDDPRIVSLRNSVSSYNEKLRLLGIRDHQVEYARFSIPIVICTLLYRILTLCVMAIGTLPGLILFAPVFVATKYISIKKSRQALAASTVKLQGRDVMATWKLIVALAVAPLLYAFYTTILTFWVYRRRASGNLPSWLPLPLVVISSFSLCVAITFAALRIGETGMDIVKSLRPLLLCLNPSSANSLVQIRRERANLSAEVTEVINMLGPELFPDFDAARIVADPFRVDIRPMTPPPRLHRRSSSSSSGMSDAGQSPVPAFGSLGFFNASLPRNESFGHLGNIGLFSTRPPSRNRSRSRESSVAVPVRALSTLDSREGFEEVTRRIRGAMQERRERRRSEEGISVSSGWEGVSASSDKSGVTTPGSEVDKKEV